MMNPTKPIDITSFNHIVLVCNQCGSYLIRNNETFQVCHCTNILVLDDTIQPDVQLITNCKMCSLLAVASSF